MLGRTVTIIEPKKLEGETGKAHFPGPLPKEGEIIKFKTPKSIDK